MAERRSLAEGITPTPEERAKEKAFVYGQGRAPAAEAGRPHGKVMRVDLHTRVSQDLAAALKRVSLERQLAGEPTSAVQEIVEEALGAWMEAHRPR